MQVSSWIAARLAVLVEFAVFLISSTIGELVEHLVRDAKGCSTFLCAVSDDPYENDFLAHRVAEAGHIWPAVTDGVRFWIKQRIE